MKQRDVLSPLLFNAGLEHAIKILTTESLKAPMFLAIGGDRIQVLHENKIKNI